MTVRSHTAMKSLCSLNMNSTKLSADTYEDLKVIPSPTPSCLCTCKGPEAEKGQHALALQQM